jgi:hypothetical protein
MTPVDPRVLDAGDADTDALDPADRVHADRDGIDEIEPIE